MGAKKAKKGSKASSSEDETKTDPIYTPVTSTTGEEAAIDAEVVDDGTPKVSPYALPAYVLEFGSSSVEYTVAGGFLDQFPTLMEWVDNHNYNKKFSLPDVDEDVGHILVHFLYTGAYQSLKPRTETIVDTLVRYKEALSTYCLAKQYGLDNLKVLAWWNVAKYSTGISIFDKLNVATNVYEKLDEDMWFSEHLKKEIEAAFEQDAALFTNSKFSDIFGNVKNLDKVLLRIITEIYASKIKTQVVTSVRPVELDKSHQCATCGCVKSEVANPSADAPVDEFEYSRSKTDLMDEPIEEESPVPKSDTLEESPIAADPTPDLVVAEEYPEAVLPPESQIAETELDGFWGGFVSKKKKKALMVDMSSVAEDSPLVDEALPESAVAEESPEAALPRESQIAETELDGFWGGFVSKKKKKGKKIIVEDLEIEEPLEEAAPDPAPDFDFGGLDTTTKNATKESEEADDPAADQVPTIEAYPEIDEDPVVEIASDPPVEDTWVASSWASWGLSSKEKKRREKATKGKGAREEMTEAEEVVLVTEVPSTPPALELTPEPEDNICPSRVEHLLKTHLWMDCQSCRAQVKRMLLQFLDGVPHEM